MIKAYEFHSGRNDYATIEPGALAQALAQPGAFVWVDFEKSSGAEATPILDGVFHFHPLAIEDCIADTPSPKIEEFLPQGDDKFAPHLFIVVHAANYQATGSLVMEELNLFLGKNFLVTYHDQPLHCVNALEERCKKGGPALGRSPDRLAHALLDQLADSYRPALDGLSGQVTALEERAVLVVDAERVTIQEITRTKKDVVRLRQHITPQLDVMSRISRGEFALIQPRLLPYFRDVADALSHISTEAQTLADSLTAILQVHLSMASNRTSDIVKVLTIFTVLTTPLMIIGTWYGMNFKDMPELDWRHGYAVAVVVMVISTALTGWYFKKRKWF